MLNTINFHMTFPGKLTLTAHINKVSIKKTIPNPFSYSKFTNIINFLAARPAHTQQGKCFSTASTEKLAKLFSFLHLPCICMYRFLGHETDRPVE